MNSLRCIAKLCTTAMASKSANIRGIIFDLDGTLTVPCLKFKKLRQQLGIGESEDILGHVAALPENDKIGAMEIIEAFELEGRKNLKLQPGLNDLFEFIIEKKLKLALLTRNNMDGVQHFLEKCQELGVKSVRNDVFSIILTRDFKPVKPDPAPVLHIASKWDIEPSDIIVVGDHLQDIHCGQRAGSTTVLINNKSNQATKQLADLNVDSLLEIIPIIKTHISNPPDD